MAVEKVVTSDMGYMGDMDYMGDMGYMGGMDGMEDDFWYKCFIIVI